ncbi:MAG: hypothetical protein H6838_05945 [Planctomycetes bacterium]|nr:hypothetical protein [Planctomycetota bacterium]
MNSKNFLALTAALSIAAIVGVITWHTLYGGAPALAGGEAGAATGSEDDGLRAENARLRDRLRELEAADAAAPSRDAAPRIEEPPPPPPPEVAATGAQPKFAFDDPRYAEALAKVDWQVMGEVTKEMQPLLVKMLAALEETGEVPPELAVQIQSLNSKLVEQVPALLASGAPGFGTNGNYTHPLFVANTLASTLAAGGLALDAAQQAKIAGLVQTFSVENETIANGQHEFALEQLLAETEMKDRFYEEVGSRLTPEQHAQIYPEGADHDGANLFGTGLMTRPYAQPIPAKNAIDFARLASNRLGEQLGLDEATAGAVRNIVERMATAATDLWQDPADKTETKLHMLRSGRMTTALRHQLAIMREINRQVNLTPEQKQKLAKMRGVLVPLPR